jgi:hypothetical protein
MSLVFFPGVSTTPIVAITDRLTSRSRSQAAQDGHNGHSSLLGNSVVGLWHMVPSAGGANLRPVAGRGVERPALKPVRSNLNARWLERCRSQSSRAAQGNADYL